MDFINKSFTIFMADDDPDDRFLAEKAFEEIGFSGSLRFAQDGEELLKHLNQSPFCDSYYFMPPGLILLDLNMPLKDGWETLEEIKNTRDLQDIPVIIWTTSNDEQDRLKSIEMGADGFISKSCDFSSVLQNFRFLIEKYCGSSEKI